MHADQRQIEEKLANKIAIAHGIETVLADLREAELARDQFAIEHDGRAGESAGAQRENVSSLRAGEDAAVVALERLDVREKIMAERNRLRSLQVRVTRHEHVLVLLRQT